jgi:hypothetical protein
MLQQLQQFENRTAKVQQDRARLEEEVRDARSRAESLAQQLKETQEKLTLLFSENASLKEKVRENIPPYYCE